jgi:hypothetical protein
MLWIDHGLVGDEINLDEVREQGKQNFWRKSIWRSRDSRCKGPEAEWSSSEEAAKTGTYKTLEGFAKYLNLIWINWKMSMISEFSWKNPWNEEIPEKPELRNSNIVLKSGNVIRDKKRLGNHSRVKDSKWQLNAIVILVHERKIMLWRRPGWGQWAPLKNGLYSR